MKILMYTRDTVGIKSIVDDLADAMKKRGYEVEVSDKIDYDNFDVVHVHMDYSQFHPWGLGLIPILIKLKLETSLLSARVTLRDILKNNIITLASHSFCAKTKNLR